MQTAYMEINYKPLNLTHASWITLD